MAKYVMALDAGTTSNRCILFNEKGEMCSVAQKEFTQYFPKPGWVEHDANEIWSTQLGVAVEAMSKIGASAEDIAAIGQWLSGSRRYFLQNYKESEQVIRPVFTSYSREPLENFQQILRKTIPQVEIRGI